MNVCVWGKEGIPGRRNSVIKDPDKLSANMLMGRRGIHMIQYDMAKDMG